MYYVTGTKENRDNWFADHIVMPYFENRQLIDNDTVALWNNENDNYVTMYINIDDYSHLADYTVARFDEESGRSYDETDFDYYEEAYEAYIEIENENMELDF